MWDLVDFHKPIEMRHKLGLSCVASIHCQQAREIGRQRGQGLSERGGGERRGGAAWRRMGVRATRRIGDTDFSTPGGFLFFRRVVYGSTVIGGNEWLKPGAWGKRNERANRPKPRPPSLRFGAP
jgi:hypothetical protein